MPLCICRYHLNSLVAQMQRIKLFVIETTRLDYALSQFDDPLHPQSIHIFTCDIKHLLFTMFIRWKFFFVFDFIQRNFYLRKERWSSLAGSIDFYCKKLGDRWSFHIRLNCTAKKKIVSQLTTNWWEKMISQRRWFSEWNLDISTLKGITFCLLTSHFSVKTMLKPCLPLWLVYNSRLRTASNATKVRLTSIHYTNQQVLLFSRNSRHLPR